MLIKIEMENFLSFNQPTTLDFTATRYEILEKSNQINDILKGALFIGPNASGKSNALKAIRLLLLLMYGDKEVDLSEFHCIFCRQKTMRIKYTFDIKSKHISYEIKHDVEKEVLTEILIYEDKTVMNRIGSEGLYEFEDKKIHKSDLSYDKLFLRGLDLGDVFGGHEVLSGFIEYIANSYYFDTILRVKNGKGVGSVLKLYREQHYEKDLNRFLKEHKLGFDVEYTENAIGEGVEVATLDREGRPIRTLYWKRESFNIPIPMAKESLGNQITATIMELLFLVTQKGGMLILDEFSSGLHNSLEELIIRYFMKSAGRSQLFLTSHSTNLISNYVMRPDQIYIFVFKDKNGSEIKRVSDFRPREAQNLEKMYLSGVFEGLPNYEKI